MSESSEEKSEDATPKRLREARRKGQVPKSKDLTTIFEMAALFVTLCLGMGYMGGQIKIFMQRVFLVAAQKEIGGPEMLDLGKMALMTLAKVSAPALLAGFSVSLIIGFMQVGPIFSLDPLAPQGKKLNPIEGIKNMFKTMTLIELVKNILKLSFIFFIAYKVLDNSLYQVLQTARISTLDSARVGGSLIFQIVLKVVILFIAIATADFMIQRWQFMKQMRMTKEEVKREYKQDEGDPHIKSHRKALHREMVFGDVGQQVKNADAVVTNPTHVAVAIKYDKNEMGAPEVVAKGQRLFAEKIKKLAEEYSVPIIRNVALAWSLVELEEGQEVPEELYTAVAETLAIVYKMKQAQEAKRELRGSAEKVGYI
ncbi:MAG: EscU/YscU/HrcU family type III secretion system export apparatus switch protein [Deltaproteobacteria bacterium]|nr:EscU/YscU/HrcU family type III secretion system export apparatus switch protein [Deltaproteobacteria bacterium]